MISLSTLLTLTTILTTINLTLATSPEPVRGFHLAWSDSFDTTTPEIDLTKWRRWTGQASNNEQQTYLATGSNCEISSSKTLLITPTNTNGHWESCRIESLPAFAAKAGGQTIVQARLKLGDGDSDVGAGKPLQGIWPAFWSLGASVRHGTNWPSCGEIDTFENINGGPLGHGTVHCGTACNDPVGLGSGMTFSYGDWHTWAHAIDLRSGEWRDQNITWYLDGKLFKVLKGGDVGDRDAWANLAAREMILTLNVAVGGSWAGDAVAETADGKMAGMEVGYVAVYESD
ncbi:related to endo-1,3-beta-glucanase [Rhynchosporium secalis]|uniref:Related to endo-1,3-beta-glucanase n=1 Tax=Rhynchosporium secalis TaxID=38038 RepID=A0A1E1LXW2_RHYSE|nr:related to endo-1,3-beta-glucanase [Rhynchosporium secalis]